MTKRWTRQEDEFIHAYFDAMGDAIGPRDLGRPKGSVMNRAHALRKSGAWAALDRMRKAEHDYLRCIGTKFAGDDA